METMIPAWTYGQVWRRYEHYCDKKRLEPFSEIAMALWSRDISILDDGDFVVPPEVEIIEDILNAAKRTS